MISWKSDLPLKRTSSTSIQNCWPGHIASVSANHFPVISSFAELLGFIAAMRVSRSAMSRYSLWRHPQCQRAPNRVPRDNRLRKETLCGNLKGKSTQISSQMANGGMSLMIGKMALKYKFARLRRLPSKNSHVRGRGGGEDSHHHKHNYEPSSSWLSLRPS